MSKITKLKDVFDQSHRTRFSIVELDINDLHADDVRIILCYENWIIC